MTEKKTTNTDKKKNNKKTKTDKNAPTWETPYRENNLKESSPAFETFLIYRDMGIHRNLKRISERYGLEYRKLLDWSRRYKWTDRINEMNKYNAEKNKQINQDIQKKEIDNIYKRMEAKSKLINVIYQVLIKNANKYGEEDLKFKEFAGLLKLASKVENMNINDLANMQTLQQYMQDDGIDTQNINALVNNFSMLLTHNNKDAIDEYEDDIKDDNY